MEVREYGAKGDGRTDDTAAIQRAVDAGKGGVVFGAGTYRVTRPVRVELAKVGPAAIRGEGGAVLVMAGAGAAIELVGTHKGSADPKTMTGVTAEREQAPLVEGLTIRGEHEAADGIRVEGTIHGIFTRLLLTKLRNGMVLTGRNRNVVISDVHVYDNAGIGILLEKLNLHQVNIVNSHVSYNKLGGIVVRESEVRNLQIANCDIEANMTVGGEAAANVLFDVRGGSIREGAITGCSIQHYGRAKGSANVRMLGNPKAPGKVGFFSIADNMISDAEVNVHLRDARGVTVTGNTMGVAYGYNLLVENSSNVVVGPNTLDQNPDYDEAGYRNTVLFDGCVDSKMSGVQINRSRGAEAAAIVRRSRYLQITDVTILDSDGVGLLLEDVEWTHVSGCVIQDRRAETKDPVAIRLTRGKNNRVSGNWVKGAVELAEGAVDALDQRD